MMLPDAKRCYTLKTSVIMLKTNLTSLPKSRSEFSHSAQAIDETVSCEQVDHELVQQHALFLLAEPSVYDTK